MPDPKNAAEQWADEVAQMDTGDIRTELSVVLDEGFAPEGWAKALDNELQLREGS